MINRPGRSPRTLSVTSPAHVSLLTCGFTLATVTVATLNTSVAHADAADPDCEGLSDNLRRLCDIANTPPTPAPSSGGSGGGFSVSEWVSDHAGLIMLIAAGIAIWITIAAVRESAEEKEQKAAAQAARGRALAEQHHARAVQRAHEDAAAQVPPREAWDPMNMGAVPPAPEPVIPAPPSTDPADLQRYTAFGAVTPWEAGTAFAAVVSRDGSLLRATAAWLTAAQEAGLGEVDEDGTFTPSAVLTNVRYDDGDVELVVQPAGLHIAERQLDKALPFLVVEARVERATPFVREAATGRYVTRLTNVVHEQPAPASAADEPSIDIWKW